MKYFGSTLIALILLLSFSTPSAYAQGGAGTAATSVLGGAVQTAIDQAINAASKIPSVPTSDVLLTTKEVQMCFSIFGFGMCFPGLDKLAIQATKLFIERMVDSTVKWINSGFEGNPAYITNPGQYFSNIADGAAGAFIQGSDVSFLCSPFRAQVKLALQTSHREPSPFQCTLTGAVANLESFYKDFSSGGWGAWFAVTQTPSNNPQGAFLEAKIELDSRVANALGLKRDQLNWGRGFLSKQTCLKNAAGVEIRDWGTGECKAPGPIVTPGVVIEGQLKNVLGTGVSQLELADEFDELIGALLGQLLEKTVFAAEGLFGATKVTSTVPPPRTPGIPDPSNPAEFFRAYCEGLNLDCDIFNTEEDAIFYIFTTPTTVIFLPKISSFTMGGVEDVIYFELNEREVQHCEGDSALYGINGCQYFKSFNSNERGQNNFYGYVINRTATGRRPIPGPGLPPGPDSGDSGGNPGTYEERIVTLGRGNITVPSPTGTIGIIGGVEVPPPPEGGGPLPPPGTQPASLLTDLVAEREKYGTPMTEEELGKLLNAVAWKNRASGWRLLGKAGGANCPSPAGPRISCDYLVHQPTMYGYDVLGANESAATPHWDGPDTSIAGQVSRGERTIVAPVEP